MDGATSEEGEMDEMMDGMGETDGTCEAGGVDETMYEMGDWRVRG